MSISSIDFDISSTEKGMLQFTINFHQKLPWNESIQIFSKEDKIILKTQEQDRAYIYNILPESKIRIQVSVYLPGFSLSVLSQVIFGESNHGF